MIPFIRLVWHALLALLVNSAATAAEARSRCESEGAQRLDISV